MIKDKIAKICTTGSVKKRDAMVAQLLYYSGRIRGPITTMLQEASRIDCFKDCKEEHRPGKLAARSIQL